MSFMIARQSEQHFHSLVNGMLTRIAELSIVYLPKPFDHRTLTSVIQECLYGG